MVAIASLPTTGTVRRPSLVAVPSGPAPQARAAGTARRLLLAAGLALVVLAALAYLAVTPSVGAGAAAAPHQVHVVAEGETLWSIAQAHAPAGEAATYVERLVTANAGATVVAGQQVVLPTP